MDDNEISDADIKNQYQDTVVLYKGAPVYVSSVEGRILRLINLVDKKRSDVKFSFKWFIAPTRLGMVNIQKTCIYVERVPHRQWQVGINNRNTTFSYASNLIMPADPYSFANVVGHYKFKEFADCINGDYPSLKGALESAIVHSGMFAFDRWFAVDYQRQIYYKAFGIIGNVTDDLRIVLKKDYEHLYPLLNKYENIT